MSGTWCSWCDNSRKDWVDVDHVKGVPWTLDSMKARRDELHNGLLKDDPNNRRGCVDTPLFDGTLNSGNISLVSDGSYLQEVTFSMAAWIMAINRQTTK